MNELNELPKLYIVISERNSKKNTFLYTNLIIIIGLTNWKCQIFDDRLWIKQKETE